MKITPDFYDEYLSNKKSLVMSSHIVPEWSKKVPRLTPLVPRPTDGHLRGTNGPIALVFTAEAPTPAPEPHAPPAPLRGVAPPVAPDSSPSPPRGSARHGEWVEVVRHSVVAGSLAR